MDAFTRQLYKVIGLSAIAAPLAHTITDIWEVLAGGYSVPLLIVNYIAFVVLPFTVIGLYAVQRPAIRMAGLYSTSWALPSPALPMAMLTATEARPRPMTMITGPTTTGGSRR